MGLVGFITRRVLKAIVFKFIDETEYDPRVAQQKKKAASKIITAVGLGISFASFDFLGLLDALHDQGIDIAQETIAQAAEHGSDVANHASTFADHASNTVDLHFGGSSDFGDGNWGTAEDGTPIVYKDAQGYGWSGRSGSGVRYQKKFGEWDRA